MAASRHASADLPVVSGRTLHVVPTTLAEFSVARPVAGRRGGARAAARVGRLRARALAPRAARAHLASCAAYLSQRAHDVHGAAPRRRVAALAEVTGGGRDVVVGIPGSRDGSRRGRVAPGAVARRGLERHRASRARARVRRGGGGAKRLGRLSRLPSHDGRVKVNVTDAPREKQQKGRTFRRAAVAFRRQTRVAAAGSTGYRRPRLLTRDRRVAAPVTGAEPFLEPMQILSTFHEYFKHGAPFARSLPSLPSSFLLTRWVAPS